MTALGTAARSDETTQIGSAGGKGPTAKPERTNVVPLITRDQTIDITRELRKDIIVRDWAAVHINGDRAKPVWLPERVKRIWR